MNKILEFMGQQFVPVEEVHNLAKIAIEYRENLLEAVSCCQDMRGLALDAIDNLRQSMGIAEKTLQWNIDRLKLYQEINSQSTDEFSRGINLQLRDTPFFEQFYVAVRQIRVRGRHERDALTKVIKSYYPVFGAAVFCLASEIEADYILYGLWKSPDSYEPMLKDEVVKNLEVFIDNIIEYKTEKVLKDGRKCDIFVQTVDTPIIIELKTSNTDPKKQLMQYAKDYGSECELISITTSEIPANKRHPKIKYYTLRELRNMDGWASDTE